MVAYDVIMLLVILVTAFRGFQKGLAWQVASLAAIVVSYLVSVQFRGPVSEMIQADPPWDRIAAMLLLFMGTSLVIWILFQGVRQSIEKWKLRDFDRQMGALVGIAKGVIICALITLFAVALLEEPKRQAIIQSKSGAQLARLLNRAQAIMPDEIRNVLAPYLQQLPVPEPGGDPNSGTVPNPYLPPSQQSNPYVPPPSDPYAIPPPTYHPPTTGGEPLPWRR